MTLQPISTANTMTDLVTRVQEIVDLLNSGTLTSNSGSTDAIKAVNSTYNATDSDQVLIATGTFTITLFSVVEHTGYTLLILNRGAGAITVQTINEELIESDTSIVIDAGQSCTLKSTGAKWLAIPSSSANAVYAATAGTANNTTYAFGKSESGLNVNSASVALLANNATYAFGKSEGALNANSALTANNTTYAFGKQESALNVNNAINLNGNPAAYFTNASNLGTGTVPTARLGSGTANSSTFLAGDSSWKSINTSSAPHALVGSDHTVSGLTIGHVLKATGALTFAFDALAIADLSDGANLPKLDANNIFTGALQTLPLISTNGLVFPATQVHSADAHTLDDYEEGTWTPVLGGATGTSGQAYSAQVGHYTKIGRLVVAHFSATLSTVGTVSGFATIGGLPFAAAMTGTLTFAQWNVTKTAYIAMGGRVDSGASFAYIWAHAAVQNSCSYIQSTNVWQNNASVVGTITYIAAT